jgi:hypothetical protein
MLDVSIVNAVSNRMGMTSMKGIRAARARTTRALPRVHSVLIQPLARVSQALPHVIVLALELFLLG